MDDRTVIATETASTADMEKAWLDRESYLLKEIDGDARWYKRYSKKHMLWHRCIGILVLLCSVLAPVTVSTNLGRDKPMDLFWGINMGHVAIGMTVILALAECVRRFFRFEQMWVAACLTSDALKRLENHYLDHQVGIPVGSPAWTQNLHRLRADRDAVMERDAKDFFHTVMNEAAKLSAAGPAKTARRGG